MTTMRTFAAVALTLLAGWTPLRAQEPQASEGGTAVVQAENAPDCDGGPIAVVAQFLGLRPDQLPVLEQALRERQQTLGPLLQGIAHARAAHPRADRIRRQPRRDRSAGHPDPPAAPGRRRRAGRVPGSRRGAPRCRAARASGSRSAWPRGCCRCCPRSRRSRCCRGGHRRHNKLRRRCRGPGWKETWRNSTPPASAGPSAAATATAGRRKTCSRSRT